MYNISTKLYLHVACLLFEKVGDGGYYSDVLDFEWGDVECSLHLSAVVYHEVLDMPEGRVRCLADLIPVWWEFHTFIDGEEVLNTFSFSELRQYIEN